MYFLKKNAMIILFFWAFAAYGITSIIVWGSIFESLRENIKKRSKFFGDLISCVLCTSTWVGFILSILTGGMSIYLFDINYVFGVFLDGMFTCGIVWLINSISEFYEENRISSN